MNRQVIRLLGPIHPDGSRAVRPCRGLPSGGIGEPAAPIKLDVIFVATDLTNVNTMLTLAGVMRDDLIYDLGCGDGRIVIAAATSSGGDG